MNWRDERPDGRWLLLVLVAHLALAWLLLLATGRKAATVRLTAAQPVVMVWLSAQPPERAAAKPSTPPTPALRRPPPTAALAAQRPRQPGATTPADPPSLPITVSPDSNQSLAGTPSLAPSPAAAAPAPLNLQWPTRQAGAVPPAALTHDDPRLGSPMNRSERFADQMGTDQRLVEEASASGRRLRRGNSCVDLRPNRNGQLDPFNGSVRPPPALASDCLEHQVAQPSRSRRPPS